MNVRLDALDKGSKGGREAAEEKAHLERLRQLHAHVKILDALAEAALHLQLPIALLRRHRQRRVAHEKEHLALKALVDEWRDDARAHAFGSGARVLVGFEQLWHWCVSIDRAFNRADARLLGKFPLRPAVLGAQKTQKRSNKLPIR